MGFPTSILWPDASTSTNSSDVRSTSAGICWTSACPSAELCRLGGTAEHRISSLLFGATCAIRSRALALCGNELLVGVVEEQGETGGEERHGRHKDA